MGSTSVYCYSKFRIFPLQVKLAYLAPITNRDEGIEIQILRDLPKRTKSEAVDLSFSIIVKNPEHL